MGNAGRKAANYDGCELVRMIKQLINTRFKYFFILLLNIIIR